MIGMRTDHATLWVCVDCYFAHHGLGEDDGPAPDREPLSLIGDGDEITAGLVAEEHDAECPVWLGDPNRPDVPVREEECDCETITFTWSSCDGCGSHLGGERYALTLWLSER